MKTRTLKTAGTAVLGIAFTALAAGPASAAGSGQAAHLLGQQPMKKAAQDLHGAERGVDGAQQGIDATVRAMGVSRGLVRHQGGRTLATPRAVPVRGVPERGALPTDRVVGELTDGRPTSVMPGLFPDAVAESAGVALPAGVLR